MSEVIFLYSTAPDMGIAESIVETLVRERLVACGNILPPIQSVYWWDGQVEKSKEVAFLLKTTEKNKNLISEKYKTLHPYEVPCLLQIDIPWGQNEYMNWLMKEANPLLKTK